MPVETYELQNSPHEAFGQLWWRPLRLSSVLAPGNGHFWGGLENERAEALLDCALSDSRDLQLWTALGGLRDV